MDAAEGAWLGGWRRRRAAERLARRGTPEAVRALAEAYVAGADERVVAIAETTLAGLDDPASIDAVCEVVIASGDERLAELVTKARYVPSSPERRALLLFLTGRFDGYAELDFDGGLLAAANATADGELRTRLAARARVALAAIYGESLWRARTGRPVTWKGRAVPVDRAEGVHG